MHLHRQGKGRYFLCDHSSFCDQNLCLAVVQSIAVRCSKLCNDTFSLMEVSKYLMDWTIRCDFCHFVMIFEISKHVDIIN